MHSAKVRTPEIDTSIFDIRSNFVEHSQEMSHGQFEF